MPIFEYICGSCGKSFEKLASLRDEVHCPACKSRNVEKQFSAFAVARASASAVPDCGAAGCGFEQGGCGSGQYGGCCRHHHD